MSFVIRDAKREDSAAIWSLITDLAIFEKLTEYLTGDAASVEKWLFEEPVASGLVAEDDGDVIGYAIYFPVLATFRMKPGLWLEDLYVRESHRGQGIGKALIQEVIGRAKQQGFARVDWSVLDWNKTAIDFYEALGAQLLPDWRICRFHL